MAEAKSMDLVLDAVCTLLAVKAPTPPESDGLCLGVEPLVISAPAPDVAAGAPAAEEPPTASQLALRSVAASAALRPRTLSRVAHEVLRHFDRDRGGALEARHVTALAVRAYAELGLPRPSARDLHLSVTVHDRSGCNALGQEALSAFLADLFAGCARLADATPSLDDPSSSSESTPPATPRPPPLGPPPSPVDTLRVTLRTLSGQLHRTSLPAGATTDDLRTAVAHSPIAPQAAQSRQQDQQHRFAVGGRVLSDGALLEDQGLLPGDFVEVVRATPPPARVRLECMGLCGGPSIRGSCGTFCLSDDYRKNGRPIYVRDRGLSRWNKAMVYHGDGERFLLYEEHPVHGWRWALTDDQDWSRYSDRSYAFVPGDALHPGYLEGQRWRVFRDAHHAWDNAWLDKSSLRLVVLDEEGEEE